MSELDIFDIKRIELKPGEVLAIKCDRRITRDQAAEIKDMVAGIFPNNEVLLLGPEYHIAVISNTG